MWVHVTSPRLGQLALSDTRSIGELTMNGDVVQCSMVRL